MNMAKMMKDLQKMQSRMETEVDNLQIEASSGGGIVTARMSGKKELLSLTLSPDAITPEDPELLQDLVIAAVNEAGRKIDGEIQRLTAGLAGGLNIPGMG